MLISNNVNTITDCRSMQGLFEAADNTKTSRHDQDAVVTSQSINSFFNFVLMLATKCFLVLVTNK